MESLFKLTDLETRVPLNLNVLDADGRPGVMTLREALNAWLAHRRVVLVRRSEFRLGKIAARLEVLEGYLVVFLNLDEVIAIIREADNPRISLVERFSLTDAQATAILDMRLRSLRRLEEMALKAERDSLISEREELTALVKERKGPVYAPKSVDVVDALLIAQFAVGNRTATDTCPLGDPLTDIRINQGGFNISAVVPIVDALPLVQCAADIENPPFC